jgi:hypothetical protein
MVVVGAMIVHPYARAGAATRNRGRNRLVQACGENLCAKQRLAYAHFCALHELLWVAEKGARSWGHPELVRRKVNEYDKPNPVPE